MSYEDDEFFFINAVINKERNKVLLAEMDNIVADVLLWFMTLPLGQILQLLMNHYGDDTPVIGSLSTLYNSVSNLDPSHFKSYDKKKKLLHDTESDDSSLFQNMNSYVPTYYHLGEAVTGEFIKDPNSFIVSDDVWMMPNVNRSFVQSLDCLGVAMTDMDGAETETVTFGHYEIMHLLKASFISRNPLTDVILHTNWMKRENFESGISLYDLIIENGATSCSEDMIVLNLMFEKSSKKFLFVQADQDFVDILFSMLIIPLGAAEHPFQSGTGLRNIDNLYNSISDMDCELFNGSDTKDWLLGYINPHAAQSLLTSQEDQSPFFVDDSRSRMYIVSDDLSVTPFSVCTTLSLLNQMEISPSDVEELELRTGIEGVRFHFDIYFDVD